MTGIARNLIAILVLGNVMCLAIICLLPDWMNYGLWGMSDFYWRAHIHTQTHTVATIATTSTILPIQKPMTLYNMVLAACWLSTLAAYGKPYQSSIFQRNLQFAVANCLK